MFPFEDEDDDMQWDEYGAALRPDEFQLKLNSRAGKLSFANQRTECCSRFQALVKFWCSSTGQQGVPPLA